MTLALSVISVFGLALLAPWLTRRAGNAGRLAGLGLRRTRSRRCGLAGRLLLGGDPLLLDAGGFALPLDLRIHVEDLPERQDQHRKRDGDKEIAVVFHRRPLGS